MTAIFLLKQSSKISSTQFIEYILKYKYAMSEEQIHIRVGSSGKPFLLNNQGLHYNVSHTKGAIIAIVALENVGIDIERVRKWNRRIVEKFFTENEQRYILSSESEYVRNTRFYEVWTKKEAFLKWLGTGLDAELDSFDVFEQPNIVTWHYSEFIVSICMESKNSINENIVTIENFV